MDEFEKWLKDKETEDKRNMICRNSSCETCLLKGTNCASLEEVARRLKSIKFLITYVLTHGRTILPEDYVYFATYKANGRDFIQIGGHYFSRGVSE